MDDSTLATILIALSLAAITIIIIISEAWTRKLNRSLNVKERPRLKMRPSVPTPTPTPTPTTLLLLLMISLLSFVLQLTDKIVSWMDNLWMKRTFEVATMGRRKIGAEHLTRRKNETDRIQRRTIAVVSCRNMPGTDPRCTQNRRDAWISHKRVYSPPCLRWEKRMINWWAELL